MAKKIGVVVRDRQGEALRMSLGLIVLDDEVDILVTEPLSDDTKDFLDSEVKELVANVYTTVPIPGVDIQQLSQEELAAKLLEYDNILPY
ncbi:MAG TPA: hypothetical protein VJL89_11000 [Thermodesulfovibrionia bacterium]|jgi:hypothetical protein|nr:hypothetical protein [Thermodesulfovibrionia bacterium]